MTSRAATPKPHCRTPKKSGSLAPPKPYSELDHGLGAMQEAFIWPDFVGRHYRDRGNEMGQTSEAMLGNQISVKHGHSRHGETSPTYRSWIAMRTRCMNANSDAYKNYGGRGIEICDRWNKFENFLADMGERPDGMELDRIDPNGNYEPSNCRWISPIENNKNKRNSRKITHNGMTMNLSDWERHLGLARGAVWHRLETGWTEADAVSIPRMERGEFHAR